MNRTDETEVCQERYERPAPLLTINQKLKLDGWGESGELSVNEKTVYVEFDDCACGEKVKTIREICVVQAVISRAFYEPNEVCSGIICFKYALIQIVVGATLANSHKRPHL